MATKKPGRGKNRVQRPTETAPPVVEDARLPRMGEGEVPPQSVGRRILLMADAPKRDAGSRNRMAPLRRGKAPKEKPMPKRGFPEQEPPKPPRGARATRGAAARKKEGYVRLRVLVDGNQLAVVGAKFVEGPLAEPPALPPGLAYEVALGSRRVATGAIADAGVFRSFPDPLGRPGLEGHHVVEVPRYEIAVRVPAGELTLSALPKASITLYRSRGTGAAPPAAGKRLKSQLKGRVGTVASLKGIRLSRLPKQAEAEVRRALK